MLCPQIAEVQKCPANQSSNWDLELAETCFVASVAALSPGWVGGEEVVFGQQSFSYQLLEK